MSSKRALKQAQKQAYAKHRSNITNNRLNNNTLEIKIIKPSKYPKYFTSNTLNKALWISLYK